MARVHVLSCGGTIASTPGDAGATPELSGEDLVELAPDLEELATITVEDVANRPGFDTNPDLVAEVGRRARAAVADGADAVVVTQGTDTIEETAYQLDLGLDLAAPVVVTGAQRRPDEPSSDAAANLLAAVRAGLHDRVDRGVFVAFDDELHAARPVTKAHTSKLEAFSSPGVGPVATLYRDRIAVHREPRSESDDLPVLEPEADVALVVSGGGVDASPVERALADGVDGIVVAGTGLGNTTAALGDAIGEAVEAVPVVVASRSHAGETGAVYGTPGGGATLDEHGVLWAGDLQPWKARLKLAMALTAVSRDELEQFFG